VLLINLTVFWRVINLTVVLIWYAQALFVFSSIILAPFLAMVNIFVCVFFLVKHAVNHYGRQEVCCVQLAHGKTHFDHRKGFVVCCVCWISLWDVHHLCTQSQF